MASKKGPKRDPQVSTNREWSYELSGTRCWVEGCAVYDPDALTMCMLEVVENGKPLTIYVPLCDARHYPAFKRLPAHLERQESDPCPN